MGGTRRHRSWISARAFRIFCALVFGSLSLVLVTDAPSFAAPAISLDKTAPADVLVGASIPYTLTASNPASNPDAVPEFNVTFRDVLPVGVTYNGGSTTPTGFGEPQVITDPDTGQQTLIWSNVADLSPGSTAALSFTRHARRPRSSRSAPTRSTTPTSTPTPTRARCPSSRRRASRSRARSPRRASDLASTRVSAVRLQKSEPSPEGELLRGVHDHTTVYTLTVTNNHGAAPTAPVSST